MKNIIHAMFINDCVMPMSLQQAAPLQSTLSPKYLEEESTSAFGHVNASFVEMQHHNSG